MTVPAIIPCAGKGTRLYPVSRYLSKPMLPLGSTPVIWFVLKEAYEANCEPIVLVKRSEDSDIRDYVSNTKYSDSVVWSIQKEPEGLADALLSGYQSIDYNGPTAVLLPDNIVLEGRGISDIIENTPKLDALSWGKIIVSKKEASYFGNSGDYESVKNRPESVEEVTSLQKKGSGKYKERQLNWPAPRLISREIVPPRFFELAKARSPDPETGEIDDVPIFRDMLQSETAYAIPLSGKVFDMGNPEGYLRLTSWYFRNRDLNTYD